MTTNEDSDYTVQSSREGADDWYSSGSETYTTLEGARRAVRDTHVPGFEFRIVKRTIIEEVVE